MAISPHLRDFWNSFVDSYGEADEDRFYEAFYFGDGEELANELAALVLQGTKRATAGSVWSFEAEGKRIPKPGDLSIVTNWSGESLCIIETLSVEIVPLNEVTAEFAAIEGEGDGSLSYWQQGHRDYFRRECARAGREFKETMLVACERFKVVYRPSHTPATGAALLALIPMDAAAFAAFFEVACDAYAKDNVANGRWNAADAPALAREESRRLLPEGERTPENYLFVLRNAELDADVGYLWYGSMTRGTKNIAFLYQIYIHAQFRRKGYGRQAMHAFETEAVKSGHNALALNVSALNADALRLYESVGYSASSLVMRKELQVS